jgi:S-DNA-T family DNA segregation ATPase FtsK/SpoIIIE
MAPKKPIKPNPKPESKPEQKTTDSKTNKTPKKATEHQSFWKSLKLFLTDERTRFIVGLGLFIGTLFLFMSFVSYFFTGAADQSKMDLSWREMQAMRTEIQNWASVMGAIVSETFINRWFGVSSFAILYLGFVFALRLMNVRITALWKAFFHSSFWLIWVSVFLAFTLAPFYRDFLFFSPGGQHGDSVSAWIVSYIGIPGTLLLLVGLFLVYSIISYKGTIPFLKRLFSKKTKTIVEEDNFSNEDETTEPTVAVGTEIIPEDWIVKGEDGDEEFVITPASNTNEDVPFEIEQTQQNEENKPVDAIEMEISENDNEDPYYNVAKLGKYDSTLDLSHYNAPTLDLLKIYGTDNDTQIDMVEQNANKNRIISTLQNYGIESKP